MNANEVRLLIAESLAGISPQHTGKVCNKHVWREIADLRQLAEPEKPRFVVGDEVLDRGDNRHTIRVGPKWKMSWDENLEQWWYQTEDGCWRREKTLARASKPEPKFEVGQWVQTPSGHRCRIQFSSCSACGWEYRFSEPGHWFAGAELSPCSPVCTAEQMGVGIGDRVWLDAIPVGPDGIPLFCGIHAADRGVKVLSVWALDRFRVEVQFQSGCATQTCYRWNIARIVKRGPSGPGGKPCK